ncbi:MAG TPA: hypothetical protein VFX43_01240 [Chitinophagaceae bacterium]|nr:hypothetical protein [Chitinophagaceae bacterium]
MRTLITLLLLCFVEVEAMAQSVSKIDSLLHRIESMQTKADDFYFAGTFPTYRRYGESLKLKEDNAIFYTGLIAFTLKELSGDLNAPQRIICDTIRQRAIRAYPHFRNVNGSPTFNFWRADPPLVFPHSWFLNHFNEVDKLPDDLDDTSILWLSMNAPDSVTRIVKKMMALHANGEMRWIRNTYRRYRDLPAYSTWFGVKMPVDFDFCVLCNVLYFVHYYRLPLNIHDSASVELLRQMIVDGDYLKHPAYISPHYGRTPLLLYHVARLLGRFSIPALDTLKPRLLREANRSYDHSGNWLDSVLLSTAIMRLGGDPPVVPPDDSAGIYQQSQTFFVASFSAFLSNAWKKILLNNQLIKYYFICPAYRYTLYLENLLLRQKATRNGTAVRQPGRLTVPVRGS